MYLALLRDTAILFAGLDAVVAESVRKENLGLTIPGVLIGTYVCLRLAHGCGLLTTNSESAVMLDPHGLRVLSRAMLDLATEIDGLQTEEQAAPPDDTPAARYAQHRAYIVGQRDAEGADRIRWQEMLMMLDHNHGKLA